LFPWLFSSPLSFIDGGLGDVGGKPSIHLLDQAIVATFSGVSDSIICPYPFVLAPLMPYHFLGFYMCGRPNKDFSQFHGRVPYRGLDE